MQNGVHEGATVGARETSEKHGRSAELIVEVVETPTGGGVRQVTNDSAQQYFLTQQRRYLSEEALTKYAAQRGQLLCSTRTSAPHLNRAKSKAQGSRLTSQDICHTSLAELPLTPTFDKWT